MKIIYRYVNNEFGMIFNLDVVDAPTSPNT